LKSPASTITSAVGTKKPITSTMATKKLPIEKTSTMSITKKSPGAPKVINKKSTTTMTTVVTKKKEVVNGDIVLESSETITKTTENGGGDMANGHVNGNGLLIDHVGEGVVVVDEQQQAVIETTGI
jgi:hypothetical protein